MLVFVPALVLSIVFLANLNFEDMSLIIIYLPTTVLCFLVFGLLPKYLFLYRKKDNYITRGVVYALSGFIGYVVVYLVFYDGSFKEYIDFASYIPFLILYGISLITFYICDHLLYPLK